MKDYLPDRGDIPEADFWEVRLEAEAQTSIRVKNGDVEAVNRRDTNRGNVRVLYRGGWGFSSFNDHGDVRRHAARAFDFARSVGGGDARVGELGPGTNAIPTTSRWPRSSTPPGRTTSSCDGIRAWTRPR